MYFVSLPVRETGPTEENIRHENEEIEKLQSDIALSDKETS